MKQKEYRLTTKFPERKRTDVGKDIKFKTKSLEYTNKIFLC